MKRRPSSGDPAGALLRDLWPEARELPPDPGAGTSHSGGYVADPPLDTAALARLSLEGFRRTSTRDLFDKCGRFHEYMEQLRAVGAAQVQYRVEVVGALDAHVKVRDAFTGQVREMICFDSNSYLGLHLDARVSAAMKRAIDEMGIGTPSAQVLGGTNSDLLELEELLAAVHGRDQTLIYPSGYQANVAILTALLGEDDLALVDHVSHASIHDGVQYSRCKHVDYPYRDTGELERILTERRGDVNGVLIVSDGVFSMHGGIADLPGLRRLANEHDARLMIDEAHSLGVIGPTGRGLEELFGMDGACDVMMGTFSKAPGAVGGYVCGDPALIDFLRFMSNGALFTAALPAPLCAALTTAVRIMLDEPEHRERLWANTRRLHQGLLGAGFEVPELQSPIIAVPLGDEKWLFPVAHGLYDAGIKCGVVRYPAVPYGASMLRFTVNARHSDQDIDQAVEILEALWHDLAIHSETPSA